MKHLKDIHTQIDIHTDRNRRKSITGHQVCHDFLLLFRVFGCFGTFCVCLKHFWMANRWPVVAVLWTLDKRKGKVRRIGCGEWRKVRISLNNYIKTGGLKSKHHNFATSNSQLAKTIDNEMCLHGYWVIIINEFQFFVCSFLYQNEEWVCNTEKKRNNGKNICWLLENLHTHKGTHTHTLMKRWVLMLFKSCLGRK